ncbi:MAG: hypothetical protein R3288_09975 [Woeseiaceae bacterium]|nr:hypothetical protein [Woeseiaceae bacterium]
MTTRIAAAVSFIVLALSANAALAQDHTRGWEQGHVVQVTNVHIKDGMFNAYINDLNAHWRKFLEQQIEDGDVIRYGMYANPNSRKGEPDLILVVTFKDWGTFDRGVEYFEELGERVFGGMEEMRVAGVDRGELREIGTTMTLQEIRFKD